MKRFTICAAFLVLAGLAAQAEANGGAFGFRGHGVGGFGFRGHGHHHHGFVRPIIVQQPVFASPFAADYGFGGFGGCGVNTFGGYGGFSSFGGYSPQVFLGRPRFFGGHVHVNRNRNFGFNRGFGNRGGGLLGGGLFGGGRRGGGLLGGLLGL